MQRVLSHFDALCQSKLQVFFCNIIIIIIVIVSITYLGAHILSANELNLP